MKLVNSPMDKIQANNVMLKRGLVLALAILVLPLSGMASAESTDDEMRERIDWADMAYQIRGSQEDYDFILDASETPGDDYYRLLDEFEEENYDRITHADMAYQLRGSQEDYDRVIESEDPVEEFYQIVEEMGIDADDLVWEDEENWELDNEDIEELERELEELERELEELERELEEHSEEFNELVEELEELERVLEELLEELHEEDMDEGHDYDESEHDEDCDSGRLNGTFSADENGTGIIDGLVWNMEGDVVGYLTGTYDADGFIVGVGGDIDNTSSVEWKAIYQDGRFLGLWNMLDSDQEGVLKGYYDIGENETEGVFSGKWKNQYCHGDDDQEERTGDDYTPRMKLIDAGSDRVDSVMDKPLAETEDGGIVDVGDAAVGSTLGTIALLGAGFIRRRVTGGV